MKSSEVFFIHATAKMAHDASARGDHPIPFPGWFSFFQELLAHPALSSKESLETFDHCFEYERKQAEQRRPQRRSGR